MVEAARKVERFLDGVSEEAFRSDAKVQAAVAMMLLVIGEHANKMLRDHPEITQRASTVPWIKMRGMRNIIAHAYGQVDIAAVWQTASTELPAAAAALRQIAVAGPADNPSGPAPPSA